MRSLDAGTHHGKRLSFDDSERWVLGPGLTLAECDLLLKKRTIRTLQLMDVQLINSRISVTGGLEGFVDWSRCRISGCTFTGTFEGNSFGAWPEEYGPGGDLSDCDFSGSSLRGCQFLGIDVGSLVFPKWPNFTILDPVPREKELLAAGWPGKLAFWVEGAVLCPETTVAISYDARDLVAGFDCDLDTLREHLRQLGGVLM